MYYNYIYTHTQNAKILILKENKFTKMTTLILSIMLIYACRKDILFIGRNAHTLDIKIHQYETTLEQNSKHIWKSKYCQIKDSISRNNFWQSK